MVAALLKPRIASLGDSIPVSMSAPMISNATTSTRTRSLINRPSAVAIMTARMMALIVGIFFWPANKHKSINYTKLVE
jgi:hypothetical protein